jgi:hypothetical protein
LLVFNGRSAQVVLERSLRSAEAEPGEDQRSLGPGLTIVADLSLTDPPPT